MKTNNNLNTSEVRAERVAKAQYEASRGSGEGVVPKSRITPTLRHSSTPFALKRRRDARAWNLELF
jgi:hypothetical protein